MLLFLIRPIVRFALWIFFRNVDLRGHGQVPQGRPVIFTANHPNVMLDALLLSRFAPGETPRFIGKSTLFKNPLYAWFLGALGAISVSRTQDKGSRISSNRAMLRAAQNTLKEGHSLALFPEGVSHADPKVRDLKTGAARIALRTGAESDGRDDICIVPVGLTYSDPGTFRSDVALHFGEPIEVTPFLEIYRENRSDAEKALTDRIQERLIALTRHIDNQGLEAIIQNLSAIYSDTLAADLPDTDTLSQELRAEQEIIRAVHHFSETDPDLVLAFGRRLRAHQRKLRHFRLNPVQDTPVQTARLILALLFAPPASYGFLTNALPYYLPRLFARPYGHEPEMIATVKLAIGAALFPLYYGLLFGIAYALTDARIALLFTISLPISGFFTLFYHESIWHPLRLIRKITPKAKTFLQRLAQERAELLHELNNLKVRYLKEQGQTNKPEA
ncbi:MAG: lysophospholipid acyltransferase family protein [bacterium]|nr:lysophospholipid acyltransferase family protein [bacterium]